MPEIDKPVLDPQQESELLFDLAAHVRDAHKAVQAAAANALAAVLDAGDTVLALQQELQGRGIGWQAWFRDWGYLPLSTAKLYAHLAAHRDEIEAEIARAGELSLRAAVRLVTKKKPEPSKPKEPPAAAAAITSAMTDAELTEALIAIGLDRFLRVMPAEWRPKLEAAAGNQMISRAKVKHPNLRLKNLKHEHLRIVVHSAESSPPTPH